MWRSNAAGVPVAPASSRPRRAVVASAAHNEEVAVSESTQDRPDEADEQAPKPGEEDTETVAGLPKKPDSGDGEQQSKQDQ
jgi:hypothetical protein